MPEQFERFFDLPLDGLCVAGFDGYFKHLSPAWPTLMGYTMEEMLVHPFFYYIHPDDIAATQGEIDKLANGDITVSFENRYRTRDGTYKWISWNAAPDIENHVIYAIGRDITQRKREEIQLTRSNQLLDTIRHIQSLYFQNTRPHELFSELLRNILDITDSEYGFIGEVLFQTDGAPYLKTHAITNIAWNEETRLFYDTQAPQGMEFYNLNTLFGAVITNRTAVIANDPVHDPRRGGLPEGHPPLNTFLGLPMTQGQDLLGVVGLANRPGGYNEEVIQYLQPVLSTCTHLILAYRTDQAKQQTEHDQRVSETRLRTILETVVDGIITIDDQCRIETFNAAAEKLFGHPAESVQGRNINTLMPEPYHSQHDGYVRHYLDTGQTKIIGVGREVTGLRRDGSTFPMELSVSEMLIHGQIKFTGIVRDITQRKRVEQELRNTTALQRAILDSANYSIISTDPDGVIQVFNRAAQIWLGYTEDEVVGKVTPAIIHDGEEVVRRAAALSQELGYTIAPGFEVFVAKPRLGVVDENEWIYIRKDGSRFPVLLSITALRNQEGEITGFLGVASDITERKKIDRMKSEFISTVSHELRTPLTSIRGSLGLLLGGIAGNLSAQAKTLVDIACNNSDRLVRLINDMLDIEKIESGRMDFHIRSVDLVAIVDHAIAANQAYAVQHGARIVLTHAPSRVDVEADSDRLTQVLTNLLSNAAKYSPREGTIEVSVESAEGKVRVTVTDHGPGIPEEFRDRIFQKFAQADSSDTRQKGGTGLGLNISKAIIEHLGGTIGFHSQAGADTAFHFELPVQAAAVPAATTPANSDGERILVCEDDPDVGHLLTLLLQQAGFQVDLAPDAHSAKDLLATHNYSAMTLDIMLPDQDGASLMRELRADPRFRTLPIVVVSALADKTREGFSGGAIGIADWLEKPIDAERLVQALNQACLNSASGQPHVLHVEDDPDVRRIVATMLGNIAHVEAAASIAAAQALIASTHFDLVILDLGLQDGNGAELLPLLRAHHETVPVLIFSAHEVDRTVAAQVASVMVKSRSSNEDLIATVARLIKRNNANKEYP